METEILSTFTQIFTNYGVKTFLIVLITIVLVNLIKKPIIKKANEYAIKNNCDKSVITCYITYITIGIIFILNLIYELIIANFNFGVVDWNSYAYSSLSLCAITIATYEAIKKHIKAYTAKKQSNLTKQNSTNITETQNQNTNATETKKIL